MVPLYGIRLSPALTETLDTMIAMAEENQVVTMEYAVHESINGGISFILMVGEKGKDISGLRENPLIGLNALGLLHLKENNPQSGYVFLTKEAFEMAAYQRKSRFGRWIHRMFQSGKDVILIIVASLTFGLTILQILQLLKVIKP